MLEDHQSTSSQLQLLQLFAAAQQASSLHKSEAVLLDYLIRPCVLAHQLSPCLTKCPLSFFFFFLSPQNPLAVHPDRRLQNRTWWTQRLKLTRVSVRLLLCLSIPSPLVSLSAAQPSVCSPLVLFICPLSDVSCSVWMPICPSVS